MPAINVARTDTFEVQRQKINQIGDILSNISAGGSDLQTGNLKLGDGTKSVPSLSFINDDTLGVYRPTENTIGYVSSGKNIVDFNTDLVTFYKNLRLNKRQLTSEGLSIDNAGSNYDAGSYTNISILGGSGGGALATFDVIGFNGSITNNGANYLQGTFAGIPISGGSGTGALGNFEIQGLEGDIDQAGSGYTTGNYPGVSLINGSGSGAIANIDVGEEGEIGFVDIIDSGQNYQFGDVLSVNSADVGGTGSGFQFVVSTNPGVIQNFEFGEQGSGYQPNDVLSLPGEITGRTGTTNGTVELVSTTLSTASTQITVASTAGILQGMVVDNGDGSTGAVAPGTTVQSVDSSTTLTLSTLPETDGAAFLTFSSTGSTDEITLNDVSDIVVGSIITVTSGTGQLAANTTVSSVSEDFSSIQLSEAATVAGPVTLTFTPPFGLGTTSWSYTINNVGVVDQVTITDGGIGYAVGDVLSIVNERLSQPITYTVTASDLNEITATGSIPSGAFSIGNTIDFTTAEGAAQTVVRQVYTSGGNITSILVDPVAAVTGDTFVNSGGGSVYTVDQNTDTKRFFIDTGSGAVIEPDLTLYSGNTYIFDTQQISGHVFAFSKYRDGVWSPSFITGVNSTLSTSSTQITVADTTGILEGMEVTVSSGTGILDQNTTVVSIDSATTLTLSDAPIGDGPVVLDFTGSQYTDGVEVLSTGVQIVISDLTPNLYYYCTVHPDMGGKDNNEAILSIDTNNPRQFGSGFSATVGAISEVDIISYDILTGKVKSEIVESASADFSSVVVSGGLSSGTLSASQSLSTPLITNSGAISVTTSSLDLSGNLQVGLLFDVEGNTGNLQTSGELKSTDKLNISDTTFIQNNVISSASGVNLQIQPASNQVVEVLGTTAFAIPSGNTAERPSPAPGDGDGYIRFNNQTNQYEGYSNTNQTWSSLGGVRDLDGNTTILAEESVGANDNSLWFINDNVNTVRFTPNYQEFVNVKKIKSVNVSAPSYVEWAANTPVGLGEYLKYRNNIYEVTVAGTTATSGNEPTHTSGAVTNGTTELTYFTTAVSFLRFEEISEVQIDPLGFTDLVVNGELRFSTNTISSTTNDIIIEPTGSQKTVIKGTSSLVVPVGDSNSKGNASQGSIRYNTTDSQFEGFNGAQWGGLGGVKDIDQDTKIEAETAPGNDEDILYFFNAGNNTLRLTTTQLEFDSIDTIASGTSNSLNINASTITFDSLATTIDNTDSTISFITTSKENLDFGLSTGITNDHLLRLKDTGDVVFNLGFGTGTPDNLTLLNDDLTNFELKHTRISTSKIPLVRGTLNSGNSTVYSTATESSAKVCLTAHNTTTGDKELVEYYVIDDGTDVYFTDYNNVKTGSELVSTVFDIDPSNNVRITFTLNTNLTVGDNVAVTLIKTVTKR